MNMKTRHGTEGVKCYFSIFSQGYGKPNE
ncbi:hypothetical protein E2C01_033115 [Portunus trituberculatus]|uniref:Uncharacterized protein n=1 Tax=Portunus trituberculatus TaxID=210409 RepID=A0A5B7F3B6_PORTR|nr:hypothetical protein [Portunus trituberculatus]